MKPYTYNGITKPMSHWAKYAGISVRTFHQRLSLGWSLEDAIKIPPNNKKAKGLKRYARHEDVPPEIDLAGQAYIDGLFENNKPEVIDAMKAGDLKAFLRATDAANQ